jgi:hypothetical protein
MSHIGLKTRNMIHSIKCDEGVKYERYFTISYLPETGKYEDCVTIGCLEVSKLEEGKEFYNPVKFHDPEKFEEIIIHLVATLSAFRAVKYNLEPYQAFFKTMKNIESARNRIASLTEKYYNAMKSFTS